MKKVCNKCNYIANETDEFCQNCGGKIFRQEDDSYNRPYIPSNSPLLKEKPDKTADLLTILGFVCSICGFFWMPFIFLPVALISSYLGFRKNGHKKLAIAGIVISIAVSFIISGKILYRADLIPDWFYHGIC